jgi:hypothetical protein
MSDEELRELERRFRETGSVEDHVAYLKGRLRAAALTPERLACAAFLGDAAAQQAIEARAPEPWELSDRDVWIARIKPVGKEAIVRAVLAVSRRALEVWELGFPDERRPRTAIEAAEAWVRSQTDETRKAAEAAYGGADEAATAAHPDYSGLTQRLEDLGDDDPPDELRREIGLAEDRSDAGERAACAAKCASRTNATAAAQDLYQALRGAWLDATALRRELVPWLLGEGDPLAAGEAKKPETLPLTADEEKAVLVLAARIKSDPGPVAKALAAQLAPLERQIFLHELVRTRPTP